MNWFKRILGAKEPIELRDWAIVSIENKELQSRATLRLRMRKPPMAEASAFGCAIEISWPCGGANGFPSDEENQQQIAFESALDDLSGMNGFSELVQVSTGMGKKEWLYYTCDRDRFMRDLNARLAKHEPYPIQIQFYEDPHWQIWSDVIKELQDKNVI